MSRNDVAVAAICAITGVAIAVILTRSIEREGEANRAQRDRHQAESIAAFQNQMAVIERGHTQIAHSIKAIEARPDPSAGAQDGQVKNAPEGKIVGKINEVLSAFNGATQAAGTVAEVSQNFMG